MIAVLVIGGYIILGGFVGSRATLWIEKDNGGPLDGIDWFAVGFVSLLWPIAVGMAVFVLPARWFYRRAKERVR